MALQEVLEAARRQVAAITGHPVESITGIENGDDGWTVTVEVLELERVPNTMDVLASYEVKVSDDGEVRGFERRRRYHRAAVDERRN